MDTIEKLLKTGRPAKPPEHNVQIMSDDNKPIFIDPKKYPSPHMIIYEPVTDYKVLEKFEEIAINHNGDIIMMGLNGN